jgi:hypothetical protein
MIWGRGFGRKLGGGRVWDALIVIMLGHFQRQTSIQKKKCNTMFEKLEIVPRASKYMLYIVNKDMNDEEVCHGVDLSTEVMFVQPVSSLTP